MSSIDWKGNPEATHFDPVDQNFLREVGSALLLFNKTKGWTVPVYTSYGFTIEDCDRPLIKRPELDGEDLPPEGAQWFEPETDLDFGCFYKERDGATYMWIMNGHRKAWKKSHYNGKPLNSKPISEYTGPVAKPWDGEGLPPAGTVCEHKRVHEWQKVEVFAVKPNYNGSQTALFTYENECWAGCAEPSLFRPIRTAEQIAAEERDQACTQMLADAYQDLNDAAMRQAQRLYDAGWRKQVQP